MGTIRTRGYAEQEFEAEIFTINIEIRAAARSSGEAITAGKKQTEYFLQTMLDRMELAPEAFFMKNYSVSQSYGDQPQYRFSRSVSVKVNADPALMERITELLENMSDVEFRMEHSLADVSEKEQIVLQHAVADARAKAEMLASALGQRISGVKSVNYGCPECPAPDGQLLRCAAASTNSLASRLHKPMEKISKDIEIEWEMT